MNAPRPKRHDRDALTHGLFITATVVLAISISTFAWALYILPSIP